MSNPTLEDNLNPATASAENSGVAEHSLNASVENNVDALQGNEPPGILFSRRLNVLVERAQTKQTMAQGISSLVMSTGCHGLWLCQQAQEGSFTAPVSMFGNDQELMTLLSPYIESARKLAVDGRSVVYVQPPVLPGQIVFAAPVKMGEAITDVLVGLFPTTQPNGVVWTWLMSSISDALARWQYQRHTFLAQQQLGTLSSFVNMSAAINQTDNRLDAAITLVNELKTASQASHVGLLLKEGSSGPFRLMAMSGVEFVDRQSAATQTIESSVVGMKDEAAFWYRDDRNPKTRDQNAAQSDDETILDANINLKNTGNLLNAAGCAVLPLVDRDGKRFGWTVLALSKEQCDNPQLETNLAQINTLVAGQLQTVLKSQRSLTRVALDNSRRFVKKNWVRKLAIVAGICGLLLCIPFSYKIPCDCQLQLTTRRFIAAPYDGLLEKTMVESGDYVKAGQPLARMDARHLRMQMSSLGADLESQRKKRDSALAKGLVAESQIATAEMSRLQAEIEITRRRLNETEICSPIDGVVVSGDMDKVEGAPMEIGQNLFEVGPLEELLVEIHIPENQIQYTEKGMKVKFEFTAFPFETFEGEIARIHPRAEMLGHESVFVAEIRLPNESGLLRPGMKGRAKIVGDKFPLGWNVFHSAFDRAREWLIW